MNWYKRIKIARVSGEWWLIDGAAIFADSDIGDMGHEAYVIEGAKSEILEAFGFWNDEEMRYSDWDEAKQQMVQSAVSSGDQDENELITLYGDEYLEQVPYNSQIFDTIALSKGLNQEMLDLADGSLDARDYGMRVSGWQRVESHHVETQFLRSSDMKNMANGLYDAYGDDALDQNFNIEVRSSSKYYSDIPFEVIESGDPGRVARYKHFG